MKKSLSFLITCLFLVSCGDNPVNNLRPEPNPFNGYYEMYSVDPHPGIATIYIRQNGDLKNGIKILFSPGENVDQDPFSSLVWFDGSVNRSGRFDGVFYNDSGTGMINGIFTRSGGTGHFNIAFADSVYYGLWYALPLN